MIFNNYFITLYKMLEDRIDHSHYSENIIYKKKKFQDVTKIILN